MVSVKKMTTQKLTFHWLGSIETNISKSASMQSSEPTEQKLSLTPSLVGRFTYNIITSDRNQRETPIKTDIFRALNTSVSADREQTEDLLISDHIVTARWRLLLQRSALWMKFSASLQPSYLWDASWFPTIHVHMYTTVLIDVCV